MLLPSEKVGGVELYNGATVLPDSLKWNTAMGRVNITTEDARGYDILVAKLTLYSVDGSEICYSSMTTWDGTDVANTIADANAHPLRYDFIASLIGDGTGLLENKVYRYDAIFRFTSATNLMCLQASKQGWTNNEKIKFTKLIGYKF